MKVLDLFSGIGGFSLGLERTGMRTVAFCEIDKDCQKVLRKHWTDIPIFGDVTKLDKVLLSQMEINNIDLICGGFPCQDISVANSKGKGLEGERSGLWKEYKRLIKEIKPRWVVIENVPNLRNKGLAVVLSNLDSLGYDAEWHIISACSIGAVHRRERIWIIANANSARLERKNSSQSEKWERYTKLERSNRRCSESYSTKVTTHANYNGLWRTITTEEERRQWRTKTASRFSDVFGQISEIEPTICRGNDGISRRLDKNRLRQLGNAVVPQIAELIGKQIMMKELE